MELRNRAFLSSSAHLRKSCLSEAGEMRSRFGAPTEADSPRGSESEFGAMDDFRKSASKPLGQSAVITTS